MIDIVNLVRNDQNELFEMNKNIIVANNYN